jgi:hypothetical protein
MKKILALVVIASLFSGCASTYKTLSHNNKVETARSMVQVKAESWGDDTTFKFGVDLLSLANSDTGYFAAWADDPKGMSVATAIDAILVGGTAYLYKQATDNDTTVSEAKPMPTYNINADVVVIGDGNTQTWGE